MIRKKTGKAAKRGDLLKASSQPSTQQTTITKAIHLAMQHHQAGRLHQAEKIYRQVLAIDADNADANHLLGIIASQSGNKNAAIQLIQKAISINPEIAVTHYNLGKALKELGRLDEAAASYRQALALQADYADAHNNLGNVYQEMGRLDEAAASYKQSLASEPRNAQARYNLGKVLKEMGRLEEAMTSYRQALAIYPDFAEAHNNLGIVQQELGQMDEALASYRRVLAINPESAEAYQHVSFLKKHTEYDSEMSAMEALYGCGDVSDDDRMHLAFGLGKAFEDLRHYEKAFDFIREGNRLKRATYDFSVSNTQRRFSKFKEVFSLEFFSNLDGAGNHDETPVFVLGMPRSGTSLVEQILASHPQVFGAGELADLSDLTNNLCANPSGKGYPEVLLDIDVSAFEQFGSRYIERIRHHSSSAKHITDKMPHNFRHIGFIKAILPNARIIHCSRDPMDNCLSIYKNYFSAPHKYAYELTELGCYYRYYLELMAHWRAVLPGVIHEINYEDLVSDQENQTRRLLEYVKLPWDEACLSFHHTERRVRTVSLAQVRQKIYKDSVNLWKRYERQLEPLRKALHG